MNKTVILISAISTLYFTVANLRILFFNKIMIVIFSICLVPALIVYYYFEISMAFLFFFAAFTFVISLLYKDSLLPRITEVMAFYLSLIYCFCIMFFFKTDIPARIILLIPFLIVYISAIIEKPPIRIVKIILYASYLFMMIVILITQIKLYNLQQLMPGAVDTYKLIIPVFNLTGMLFYGMIYSTNFISILPFSLNSFESSNDVRVRVKDQSETFNSKVSQKQADAMLIILCTLVFFSLCFFINKYHFISYELFLNILLTGNLVFCFEFKNIRYLLR